MAAKAFSSNSRSLRRAPDEASGAVLRFDGVPEYHFGAPNDERLNEHPLHPVGLGFYGFYEAVGSDRLVGRAGKRHWIITFHDETLEVLADWVVVIREKPEGQNTRAMLEQMANQFPPPTPCAAD